MSAAGFVLTAGGIVLANDVIFAPMAEGKSAFAAPNWRIVPATAILALVLTGFEKIAPQFGNMLGGLVFLTVLVVPVGKAPSPLENIATAVGGKKS